SVNKSELGNTSDFNVVVDTWDPATHSGDAAPDSGAYNYSIPDGGPLITGLTVRTSPGTAPKAGRQFVVTPVGVTLPPNGAIGAASPKPDSYTCKATLKGASLAGGGTGGCSFRLTNRARGKQLAVVLTVTYEGATKAVPYRFRVG